jgi:hypothetical protein
MKTTLELPGDLFREARATAARCGIPLRELVEEVLCEMIAGEEYRALDGVGGAKRWPVDPPSMPSAEIWRIEALIGEMSEVVEAEDRLKAQPSARLTHGAN